MTPRTDHPSFHYWLLIFGTAFLTMFRLGRLPLLDVDEPVYGEVGRLMAQSHSINAWLTPHFNTALWFDKPPFFYWLTGLSMSVFGTGEFAARFPSAVCAVGLVCATVALARRAYPLIPNLPLWSGFVIATGVQFFLLAHAAVTDMTLAFTLTLALLGLYMWLSSGSPWAIVLAGIATGISCLVKGPVALVLIGGQALLYLLFTRRLAHRLRQPALWSALAVCVLVAAPWYGLMIHLHGQTFIQGFLEANNVTRFLQAEHHETNNPVYYVLIFIGFFLPWTLAVPGALRRAMERNLTEKAEENSGRPTLFLLLWCALVFIFFSVSQTKLPTYIFPLFPAMSILVGAFIAERLTMPVISARRLNIAYSVLLGILMVALVILGRQYHVVTVTLLWWLAVMIVGIILCVRRPGNTLNGLAPGIAVAGVMLAAWLSPTWNARAYELSERTCARLAAEQTAPGTPIYALGLKHTSLVYYSRRPILYRDSRLECLTDMASHPGHIYVMRSVVLDELQTKYGLLSYKTYYQNAKTCLISGPITQNQRTSKRQ